MEGFTRRRLLAGAAGAGVAAALPRDVLAAARLLHQPGIATPAQSRLYFAALDTTAASRAELRELMRSLSAAAAKLQKQHASKHLTLTFGFGASLFEPGRYGLARPAALKPLPPFPGDALDPAKSGGDLAIQACAEDAAIARAAVARLMPHHPVTARWTLAGFGRASSTSRRQRTPRNLMGVKDGTDNIKADDAHAMTHDVWIGPR